MKRLGLYIVIGLLIGLSEAGCLKNNNGSSTDSLPEAPTAGEMTRFSSDAELEAYLKEQYAESVLPTEAYDDNTPNPLPLDPGNGDTGTETSQPAEAAGYSGTNVQEEGVDESDKVKTDGTYMYVAQDQTIKVVKAVPPDAMSVVATIEVNGLADSLYLFNTILVVLYTPFSSDTGTDMPPGGGEGTGISVVDGPTGAMIGMPTWIPVNSQTGILIVDISSPESPATLKEIVIDGWLASSRLVDGKLHVVQQFLPELPPLVLSYDGTEEGRATAEEENQQALEDLTIDDLLPSYELHGEGQGIESGLLIDSTGFYRPDEEGGGSIVTVTTLNLNDPSIPFQSTGIVADVHVVYASTHALYLTATQWQDPPVILTETGYDLQESTVIHKFDLTGEIAEPVGSGYVWGRILNQFSLGEHEGVLRIATTTGFANGSRNHVFCLQEQGGELKIIGKLENLAPGEQIYSARFIGTRGFLVTFVQIDPLFTLDLSDPASPKVVGELKVPGYSTYMHPLGEDHLLTIGYDTNGAGMPQGLQLSVFDVSDLGHPGLLHKELIGEWGTYSEALYDHKAFTFWADRNLLAIPIVLYEYEQDPPPAWEFGGPTFAGLYVYRVTREAGFEFLGRISTAPSDDLTYYYAPWTRGLFIDDSVYAVVSDAVRSAATDDIANTIHTLSLGDESQ
jgi:uncharacterized secreted protein with C-terminal beta-propeller domain